MTIVPRRDVFPANDDGPGMARARLAIRITVAATVLVFLALMLFLVRSAAAADFYAKVMNVHDGDTLTVLLDHHQVRIRLVEIDAPELAQAFGRRSRDSLAGMCAGVSARVADHGHDRYGRTLARVTCGELDASAEQVRRGMAWVFVRYAPKGSPLYQVQTQARLERRGLWSDAHPMAPWEWRRDQRHKIAQPQL